MLGEQINRAIDDAWARVRREILADPDELHRRLARRRSKSLTRPARASCIALRASDRRITPMHWLITPEHALDLDHPGHPYEPIEHEVTIQKHAIHRYCNPIRIARPNEVVKDVARRLGVSQQALRHARLQGVFHEYSYKGLDGKLSITFPVIYRDEPLDSGFGRFHAPPHPAWGASWEFLSRLFPGDFEQTVVRTPHVARVHKRSWHPQDPSEFWGWRWICPSCKKRVRTIYYPLPVRTMFDRCLIDPVIGKKLCDADLPQPPPPTFACKTCHGVQYLSTTDHHGWNQLISYLSGGLLYGCEVPKPAAFVPERKNTRSRQLHREAPMRRKVLTRLSNGWSNFQIAKDLQISRKAVNQHIYIICKEEDVPDRHALAEKLNFAVSSPLNYIERAAARRFHVREMLLQNCTYKEMCKKLRADFPVISKDVTTIFRIHGVKGHGFKARRALAQKLGVPFTTHGDHMRQKIAALRDSGLTCKQVAKAVGLSKWMVCAHISILKKQKALESAQPAPTPS